MNLANFESMDPVMLMSIVNMKLRDDFGGDWTNWWLSSISSAQHWRQNWLLLVLTFFQKQDNSVNPHHAWRITETRITNMKKGLMSYHQALFFYSIDVSVSQMKPR